MEVALYKNKQVLDTNHKKIGLRTIYLIREKDAIGDGVGFKFNFNGHDVFMKGGNYIPPDMLMPRVTEEIYRSTI